MKLHDPVRIFTLMKQILETSNNVLCTFLNFKKAARWKPEAFLHEVNIYKIDSGGKHVSFWFTMKENFLKISNYVLFCPYQSMKCIKQVSFDFSRSLNTDLLME